MAWERGREGTGQERSGWEFFRELRLFFFSYLFLVLHIVEERSDWLGGR